MTCTVLFALIFSLPWYFIKLLARGVYEGVFLSIFILIGLNMLDVIILRVKEHYLV